jgi:SAM-dependent methyltransferase
VVSEPAWKAVNRAHWDEKVALHLGPHGYDLTSLRAGHGRFNAIEERELWPVDGKRILHLHCHFGADSLKLAQRGASVVGLDFSTAAIDAARRLADELGLADRARFVHADLYDAPAAIPEAAGFDMVFVTWGAICWLPDIQGWARVVAHFLKPGGSLYLADAHPAAMVFDDAAGLPDGRPGFFAPYFSVEPVVMDEPHDYVDETATVENATTHTWIHPLGDIVSGLLAAGMALDWLHEHDAVTWRMFDVLVEDAERLWRWPDKPWLPLAFSLRATRG